MRACWVLKHVQGIGIGKLQVIRYECLHSNTLFPNLHSTEMDNQLYYFVELLFCPTFLSVDTSILETYSNSLPHYFSQLQYYSLLLIFLTYNNKIFRIVLRKFINIITLLAIAVAYFYWSKFCRVILYPCFICNWLWSKSIDYSFWSKWKM